MPNLNDLAIALGKAIDVFSVLCDPKSTREQRSQRVHEFEMASPLCDFAVKAHEQAEYEGQECFYCPMACGWKNNGGNCFSPGSAYQGYVFARTREEELYWASVMLNEAQQRFGAVLKVALYKEGI